jgi:hypothetical protein
MKRFFLTGATALVLGGFIAGCSKDDIDNLPIVDSKLKAYQETFVDAYGKIDPNQSWGFTKVSEQESTTAGVRVTRGHNADANMWAKYGYDVPDPLTDAQKDKVRRWFQQHKNPQGVAIDYTTFFVQDVYKGGSKVTDDSKTTEQYTAANGDVFYGSNQMDWLTAGSINDHINNYNNAQCSVNNNVWDGKTYQDGYTPTGNMEVDFNFAKQHSDKIMLMVNSQTDCFGYANSRQGQQQYNDQYVIIPGDLIQQWDASTVVEGQSSDVSGMWFVGFDYESDLKHGWNNPTNSNGYLVTEVPEGTEGAFQVPNEGPYKGKWVVDGAADGYYSDWVVRITPGLLKGETTIPIDQSQTTEDMTTIVTTTEYYQTTELIEQGRVFCEDLGKIDTNDFDFNDAVFDAYVYKIVMSVRTIVTEDGEQVSDETVELKPDYKTTIVLLAAGGTLSLSVAGQEVHDALGGNSTSTIINTITDASSSYGNLWTSADPVTLGADFSYQSIVEIPIYVQYGNGETLLLDASAGWAPHKILVPIGTKWCKERVDIATTYKDFLNYVNYSEECWNKNIELANIYSHPKDNYQPRSTKPEKILISTASKTTYRSNGSNTTGGYQGEEVLSRKANLFNE